MNTTVNAMDITTQISRQEAATSTNEAVRDKSRARNMLGGVRLRHAALLGLVLGLVWFAVTVHSYINAIEGEMDIIHANLVAK